MLTDTNLRSKVDALWEKLWSGGLSNPLDAIEQFSYLLFLKRLDDQENARERRAIRLGQPFEPRVPEEIRWRHWSKMQGADILKHVKDVVFPALRTLGDSNNAEQETTPDLEELNSFQVYMQNAEFKINKSSLLIQACNLIDEMEISAQNQDVQGDLYEYMLAKLSTSGRNGQFRTPRHIIRMMIEMIDPKPNERIGDLAAGTAGFLVNAYQYILAKHTPPENLTVDEDGDVHGADGSLLTAEQREFLQQEAFRGYDNDSGMTMLRIGSMNLMLHGLESPRFFYMDTLSKDYDEPDDYDVILMNPPFKGAVDKEDVSTFLPDNTTKSELLFLHQIVRVLESGGRCAVIVPDGVLFGSSRAHQDIRKKLVEENRLDGVVSMPSGVFKPYAGVSTAVLLFTRGGTTDDIFFYDMAYDGYSLDDKRNPTPHQNDIPDILNCWRNWHNPAYLEQRETELADLRERIAPLHARRLELERDINRLKYEAAIANRDDDAPQAALDAAYADLDALFAELNPLKWQIDSYTRFFWVNKQQLEANKYDLSASRYRDIEQDEVFYEDPTVTAERIKRLEKHISAGMDRILGRLK
jgi:type I restriction enzyme M protein